VATPTPHRGTGKEKSGKKKEKEKKKRKQEGIENYTEGPKTTQPAVKGEVENHASGRNLSIAGQPDRPVVETQASPAVPSVSASLRTPETPPRLRSRPSASPELGHLPFPTLRAVGPNVANSERWQ
jgi:hypothetical protein